MFNQQHAGFHLIEVALTLALAATITAVSFPSLRGLTQSHILKSEARKFAALLEELSLESLQRESEISLQIDARGYYITRPARRDAGSFPSSVSIQVQAAAASRLSFFPSGAATPASIIIRLGGQSCVLTLSLRGRVASTCP